MKPEVLLILHLLLRLHVGSSIWDPETLCNKALPECLLRRMRLLMELCRMLALEVLWRGTLQFILGIPDQKVVLAVLPYMQAQGYLCLSCNSLRSIQF